MTNVPPTFKDSQLKKLEQARAKSAQLRQEAKFLKDEMLLLVTRIDRILTRYA